MTNNGDSTSDRLYVELVVRPNRRQPHQAADKNVIPIMRESNQGVLNSRELQQLLKELAGITGCDKVRHRCVRLRKDWDCQEAPYIEVIFKTVCFPGPNGGEKVRHDAANLMQRARARTFAIANA